MVTYMYDTSFVACIATKKPKFNSKSIQSHSGFFLANGKHLTSQVVIWSHQITVDGRAIWKPKRKNFQLLVPNVFHIVLSPFLLLHKIAKWKLCIEQKQLTPSERKCNTWLFTLELCCTVHILKLLIALYNLYTFFSSRENLRRRKYNCIFLSFYFTTWHTLYLILLQNKCNKKIRKLIAR